LLCGTVGRRASAVTGEQVRGAIARGVEAIKRRQRGDGGWPDYGRRGGCTALCTLALLTADVPAADPAVRKGIAAVRKLPNQFTYVVGLKIMALAAADPKKYADDIRRAANWLVEAQVSAGVTGKSGNGMWTYGQPWTGRTRTIIRGGRKIVIGGGTRAGDNSNTQFALLGLAAAYQAGVDIPEITWKRAEGHFQNAQGADGGWHYQYM
jgi:hypothetical protein